MKDLIVHEQMNGVGMLRLLRIDLQLFSIYGFLIVFNKYDIH